MEASMYLIQVLGLFYLIAGLGVLLNRKAYQKADMKLLDDRHVVLLFGLMVLVFGAMLVLKHNIWELSAAGLVTLTGWAMFVKGSLIVLFPGVLDTFKKKDFKESWYWIGGGLWAIVGLYMTYVGFFA